MPYVGLFPFLLSFDSLYKKNLALCQCPMSGFSHFYFDKSAGKYLQCNVSMPYVGLIPFLQYKRIPNEIDLNIVPTPYAGLISFLLMATENIIMEAVSVNALCRAYPISTVSFHEPSKIKGFRAYF